MHRRWELGQQQFLFDEPRRNIIGHHVVVHQMDIVAVLIPIADALYGPVQIYPQFLTTKHRSIFSRPYSASAMGIKTSTISI